ADPLSFRLANSVVGNAANTPALEMTIEGATLEFEGAATVAIVGAQCAKEVDGVRVPNAKALEVRQSALLQCGRITDGARAYLAIAGGFKALRVMGTAATYVNEGFGGLESRLIRSGDVLYFYNSRTAHSRVVG